MQKPACNTVYVDTFTNGVSRPGTADARSCSRRRTYRGEHDPGMLGADDHPQLRGGHEVTQPVYVEDAEPGDAIAIRIRSIG